MALGYTKPLTEMGTRNISWEVKAPVAQSWQPYHIHVPVVLECGNPNLQEPWQPLQTGTGIAPVSCLPRLPISAYFAKRIVPLPNEEQSKWNSKLRTSETLLITLNVAIQLNEST